MEQDLIRKLPKELRALVNKMDVEGVFSYKPVIEEGNPYTAVPDIYGNGLAAVIVTKAPPVIFIEISLVIAKALGSLCEMKAKFSICVLTNEQCGRTKKTRI